MLTVCLACGDFISNLSNFSTLIDLVLGLANLFSIPKKTKPEETVSWQLTRLQSITTGGYYLNELHMVLDLLKHLQKELNLKGFVRLKLRKEGYFPTKAELKSLGHRVVKSNEGLKAYFCCLFTFYSYLIKSFIISCLWNEFLRIIQEEKFNFDNIKMFRL